MMKRFKKCCASIVGITFLYMPCARSIKLPLAAWTARGHEFVTRMCTSFGSQEDPTPHVEIRICSRFASRLVHCPKYWHQDLIGFER